MLPGLFLNLLLSQAPAQAPPPTKPPEPHTQVEIQDRGIALPPLPEDADDARRNHVRIQALIVQETQDLETLLLALYASKGADDPLPPSLKLNEEETREAEALVQIIKDTRAAAQEKAVLDLWFQWRAVLRENGMAGTARGAAQVPPGKEKEYESLKKRLSRMDPQLWINQKDPLSVSNIWEFDDVYDHEGHDRNIAQAARLALVAQWMGPQFAQAWNPLRDHLQAYSTQLQGMDKQPSATRNPGLDLLKLKAEIQHLERFRAALWFCGVVWAEMSSSAPPPPMKPLHSAPKPR